MYSFQLSDPIDAVVFDCDGTLSLIEGIETLARANGAGARVKELTEQAISHTGMSPEVYQERLELMQPTRLQLIDLAQRYYASRAPSVAAVIDVLQRLGKSIYVVSSGMNPAVTLFSTMLGIPANHVYAVNITFSGSGEYLGYDKSSVLIEYSGKQVIARNITAKHKRVLWVGDGLNDVVVTPEVTRFVGYGGLAYREKVAQQSAYYMMCQSMTPILPLSLAQNEVELLADDACRLYKEGLALITSGEVTTVDHTFLR